MEQNFIYIPSLSAGGYRQGLIKDKIFEFSDGFKIPYRFYGDDFPEELRYKYFLMTAGHLYKNMTIREDMGLGDSFVFGDSGGFQVCTGAIEWSDNLRVDIFNFLEANSTIAANLDIPPKVRYEGKFDECLKISKENFKYFYENQSGKTKFLNVLHGENPEQFNYWYENMKGFEFNGWAAGMAFKLVNWIYILAILLKNKEFERPSFEYFHLFGISKISDFLIAEQVQKCINKYCSAPTIVTVDSSSPGLSSIYGYWYHAADFKQNSFRKFRFFKKEGIDYEKLDFLVPSTISTPVSDHLKVSEIVPYTTDITNKIVLHNTLVFKKYSELAKDFLKLPLECLEPSIDPAMLKILASIEELFQSSDPEKVYLKHKKTYLKYGGNHNVYTTNEDIVNFFEI